MVLTALVVDDDVAICDMVTLLLSLENFETVTATDAVSALDLAAWIRPDVIVLDIMMPKLDGWHVAERLQSDPELAGIPVTFWTALSDSQDTWKSWSMDASCYVPKPFGAVHLVEKALPPAGSSVRS